MIVRCAAQDPGGANVLSAFLERSGDLHGLPDVWTMRTAAPVFARAGQPVRVFHDGVTASELRAAWSAKPADVLVTATSHYRPFESELWNIAREHGCPSLAVIDQWCNLDRRFTAGRPDYVGAIDPEQRDELLASGFDAGRVLVVGQWWLAGLRYRAPAHAAPRSAFDAGAVCVLFASESISADVSGGWNAPFGFDELDAFDVVYEAACAAACLGTNISIAVKLHPHETPARFAAKVAALKPPPSVHVSVLSADVGAHASVMWADVVLGISSMLLLEAIVLGRPVVSVQPGLARRDTFVASVRGYARTLTDRVTAPADLTRLFRDHTEREAVAAGQRRFTDVITRDGIQPVLDWMTSLAGRA